MSGRSTKLAGSSITHVAIALIAMGGWAVFANRQHAMPQPLVAGLVQGVLSGIITFFLKSVIETVAQRLPGFGALCIPPLIAFAASLAILTALHAATGTPELWATIALPLAVSTSYAVAYSFALWSRKADG